MPSSSAVMDLLASWVARFGPVALVSVAAAVGVPLVVARRRYRAMGLRVAFTLSIYTACFLFFLLILHSRSDSLPFASAVGTGTWASAVASQALVLIAGLHAFVYAYHLASGFTWNLQPTFVYGVSLPGYCFFLAIILFVPGFLSVRLASMAISHTSSSSSATVTWFGVQWMDYQLADELTLVFLFSALFTWSIVYHQAGLPPLEVVELQFDHRKSHPTLQCLPVVRRTYSVDQDNQGSSSKADTSFTVCQISDPHLGLFVSAKELRNVCEEAVALSTDQADLPSLWDRSHLLSPEPTFIFLTGDYFAAEVQRTAPAMQKLKWALEPLSATELRVFACLGNHDYEGLPRIQAVMDSLGIRLLRDEREIVKTECGTFQIIGTHFIHSQRRKGDHLQKMCNKFPAELTEHDHDSSEAHQTTRTIRLMLVHDPQGLDFLAPDEKVVAFAGHNHGGQIGLETFGIRWTLPRAVWPTFTDLGLWTKGKNYWYVHRGTGQHAFPFRWGVRRERSLLKVTIQE